MAYCVVQAALLLALVASALAAVAIGPALSNPDHPGMCWSPKQNKAYSDGGHWQEDQCMRATCVSYRSELYVEHATCGAVGGEPGCKTVQDLSLPYPSCCPAVSCPDLDPAALKGEEYGEFTNWIGDYYDQSTPIA